MAYLQSCMMIHGKEGTCGGEEGTETNIGFWVRRLGWGWGWGEILRASKRDVILSNVTCYSIMILICNY